jgi:hypothetical protein
VMTIGYLVIQKKIGIQGGRRSGLRPGKTCKFTLNFSACVVPSGVVLFCIQLSKDQ